MTQTTLREYLRTTEDAISSGRYDEAMANCQSILTYFPEALEAQRLLGEVYLAQNRLEEAQQTFEWILTNDPENVIVYCDRALISERTADIDTALDCYQQAYELSRGSANIRQAFNQLSTSVGQQEFMFSRAGLARLYMRGDLLTQAIQEWEAVLAISPERLDARIGLMETYWREGLFDKAEQIAMQLLEEIPTCLKALLYLAHIASVSNIQRARALLERAESLDPELHMAQEIFSDLAARSPGDPFLDLMKKEAVLLEDGVPVNWRSASTPVAAMPVAVSALQAPVSLYGNMENLSNTAAPPPTPALAMSGSLAQEMATTPIWETETTAFTASSLAEAEMPTWQMQLEQQVPASGNEQPWYHEDQLAHANADPLQNWEALENAETLQGDWNNEAQESEQPSPPAWLDTLTRNEQHASVEPPTLPAQIDATPVAREVLAAPTPVAENTAPPEDAAADPFFFPSESDGEEETSWPDWLKSLGAQTLEPEEGAMESTSIPPTPKAPVVQRDVQQAAMQPQPQAMQTQAPTPQPQMTQTPSQAESDPWAALPAISANNDPWAALPAISANNDPWGAQNSQPDWMQQLSNNEPATAQASSNGTPEWMQQLATIENMAPQASVAPEPSPAASEQEERYLASLEDLEKNLQMQGFVPLAPGALASIAQTQTAEPEPNEIRPQEHGALSSALAQLGNYAQATPPSNETQAPWWNSMLPQSEVQAAPALSYAPVEPTNPFTALGARTTEEMPQRLSPLPATPTPQLPSQIFEPVANPGPDQSRPLIPTARPDLLIDSDLETTMKRPAIKLQPMQAREQNERPAYANNKGPSEQKHVEHGSEAHLNNHDRLVRGYQYQLSGAYDDAMQEYRLIIRNAPELVDDVISNMRALLKFNPRFSLGYRVLGDAYMHKGEYLQAMESYNKALTMAKKAKS